MQYRDSIEQGQHRLEENLETNEHRQCGVSAASGAGRAASVRGRQSCVEYMISCRKLRGLDSGGILGILNRYLASSRLCHSNVL